MEAIIINDDQRDKLLHILNIMFDDNKHYTQFRFMPKILLGIFHKTVIDDLNYIQWINQESGKIYKIHWFEFCLTHLATALYNKKGYNTVGTNNKTTITQYRGYICQEAEHPVDFLYQEFKSLK